MTPFPIIRWNRVGFHRVFLRASNTSKMRKNIKIIKGTSTGVFHQRAREGRRRVNMLEAENQTRGQSPRCDKWGVTSQPRQAGNISL